VNNCLAGKIDPDEALSRMQLELEELAVLYEE
jgi:hypothetical protein